MSVGHFERRQQLEVRPQPSAATRDGAAIVFAERPLERLVVTRRFLSVALQSTLAAMLPDAPYVAGASTSLSMAPLPMEVDGAMLKLAEHRKRFSARMSDTPPDYSPGETTSTAPVHAPPMRSPTTVHSSPIAGADSAPATPDWLLSNDAPQPAPDHDTTSRQYHNSTELPDRDMHWAPIHSRQSGRRRRPRHLRQAPPVARAALVHALHTLQQLAAQEGRAPPVREAQLLLTLAAEANLLPDKTSVHLLWAWQIVTLPDGYIPATVQEALLHVFIGEMAASALLQEVAALHRARAGPPTRAPASTSSGVRASTALQQPPAPDEDARARRARHLAHLGELSAARQALTAAPLAPATDAAFDQLADPIRRPREPHEAIDPELLTWNPSSPVELNRAALLTNLRRARKGAAPGPSGFTAEVVRVVLDADDSTQAFADVALGLGRMVALRKPTGGTRGLVVGDFLRQPPFCRLQGCG
ncbi:hypothetical protein AK812_SmicGene17906 [Symbiodinium microadriaticum]|uniref:Uncharacterized protein n=1 Tax=Symbiodinium microadriaticum TaxID=2951 RepID=A0A1Q9DWI8_SYMMI|nr:hypothetical protein AK812_SmicGene17906 [Symbiodinium microadriaticum]